MSFKINTSSHTKNIVIDTIYGKGYLNAPSKVNDPPVSEEGALYYNSITGEIKVSIDVDTWVPLTDTVLGNALASIQALTAPTGSMLYTTSQNVYSTSPITTLGRSLASSSNEAAAQAVIGIIIGTTVQAQSSALSSISSISSSAGSNSVLYTTGPNTFGITDFTSVGRDLVGSSTTSAGRTALGFSTTYIPSGDLLGTTSTQNMSNKTITDVSNDIRATRIGDSSGTFTVTVGGSAPSAGKLLVATTESDATWQTIAADVAGPVSSTDNELVRFSGTTGKVLKNSSPVLLDDSNNISGINTLTATNLLGTISTSSQLNITSLGSLTSLDVTNNITVGGTVDGVDIANIGVLEPNASALSGLSISEITQLQNINTTSISSTQWSYVGESDQEVKTVSSPSFVGGTFSSTVNLNGGASIPTSQVLTIADTPNSGTDAANKSYVDSVAGEGLKPIEAAELGTITILPNSPVYSSGAKTLTSATSPGSLSIDGITVNVGDRILVKNQSPNTQNGIYDVTDDGASPGPEWVLTRSSDFNTAPILQNLYVFVNIGATIAGSSWTLNANINTLDVDPVVFNQFSSVPEIIAGNGLTKTINTLDIGAGTGITIGANDVSISSSYIGQNSITTLGTVTTGEWNANGIDILYGGTGASTVSGARTNLGVAIGSNVQAWSTSLDSISGLTTSANKMIYTTASNIYNTTDLTSFSRTLLDDVNASDARTTLGITLPTGDIVGTTDSQILTNKTLDDNTTLFRDTSAPTSQFRFEASSITPGETRILTVPDSDITLVGKDLSQTITNKTLTSATNTIRATQLATSSTDVVLSGSSAPTLGQILTATSGSSASWQDPASFLSSITVAKNGGDYTTIVAAISAAIALSPTETSQVQIVIYPGTYNEVNPIVVPPFVSLNALKTSRSVAYPVQVTPVTSSTIIFNLGSQSGCFGIMARGASSSGGIGFYSGTGTKVQVSGCSAQDCQIGFVADGSTRFQITDCSSDLSTLISGSIGFKALNGALIEATSIFAAGLSPSIYLEIGYLITGGNLSLGTIMNIQVAQSKYCDIGYQSTNGTLGFESKLRLTSGECNRSITNGINIGAYGIVEIYSLSIEPPITIPSTYYDTFISASTSTLIGTGNKIRSDLTFTTPGSTININNLSLTPGHIAIDCNTDLHLGSVDKGYSASLGQGNAHTRGMMVLTFNGVATFNDITSSIKLPGTPAAAFPSTAVGNILYIGQTLHPNPFVGLKILLDTGISPVGGYSGTTSYIAREYWNGSAWVSNNIMSTGAIAPYLPFANRIFNVGNFHYRFGAFTGWGTTTVNGISGYWIRFRIISTLTTVPIISWLQLKQSCLETTTEGFLEYFGKAQTIVRSPFDYNWLEASDDSPADQDLYLDDTNSVGRIENSFVKAGVHRTGFVTELPENIDTSKPYTLRFRFFGDSATAGTIATVVRWGYNTDYNDNTGGLSDVFINLAGAPTTASGRLGSISTLINVASSVSNKMFTQEYSLDISNLVTRRVGGSTFGDVLWVSFERSGTGTYPGRLLIIQLTPLYTKWCEGAYIS